MGMESFLGLRLKYMAERDRQVGKGLEAREGGSVSVQVNSQTYLKAVITLAVYGSGVVVGV